VLPGPDGARYAYGYDEADRPIVIQLFDSDSIGMMPPASENPGGQPVLQRIPTGHVRREEFIAYRDDVMDISSFLQGELAGVYRLQVRDGLIIQQEVLEQGIYRHGRFEYEGRRKKRCQALSDTGQVIEETLYGPHGEQTIFRVRRDGTRFELGQPLPRGVSVKSLKQTIRTRLVALVPEVVAQAGINETIYCVALAYDGEGNDVLPPVLGIGLESERRRWQNEHGLKVVAMDLEPC
jgi:hypothetical protein